MKTSHWMAVVAAVSFTAVAIGGESHHAPSAPKPTGAMMDLKLEAPGVTLSLHDGPKWTASVEDMGDYKVDHLSFTAADGGSAAVQVDLTESQCGELYDPKSDSWEIYRWEKADVPGLTAMGWAPVVHVSARMGETEVCSTRKGKALIVSVQRLPERLQPPDIGAVHELLVAIGRVVQ